MKAFHGSEEIKKKYLERVAMHRAADALVQGQGWEDGKGCAVGCTLEDYNHSLYPIELGIPEVLAHLEDSLFEGMLVEQAMLWPERFLSAPKAGADLSQVWPQWAVWMLTDSEHGMIKYANGRQDVREAIERVADCWRRGVSVEEFRAAWAERERAGRDRVAWAAAEAAGDAWISAAADKLIKLMSAAPV